MHLIDSARLIRALAILLPAIVLAGCGTGSGKTPIRATPFVGVLVDSPVQGAKFVTATQSGFTTADGEFRYYPGEAVTFSVGGIELGTVPGAPLITPVELTGSADPGTAATPNAATKVMRFLQSVDADGNYLNGITISDDTRTLAAGLTLDFQTASDAEVDNVIGMVTSNPAIDSETALDNFYETYKSLGGSNTFSWPFPGYPAFPGSGTVDLLTNGGFESPDASAADLYCSTGWQCFNAGNFTNSTDGPSSGPVSHEPGTQSLKQYGIDSGAFQTVEAVPGATYVASVWAMNWSGDALNNLGIVQLTFWDGPDGTGTQLGAAFEDFVDPIDDGVNIYLPVQDGAEVTDWTQVTVSGTAPQGTVSAKLLLIHVLTPPALGSGTVRWDDATLTGPAPEQPPSAVELLTNRGFEAPDASAGDLYCSTGWQCFNAGNFTNNTAGPGFGPVSHDEPGTQSLKQYGIDSGAFQTVPAVPGTPYVTSVWAMNWTGDPLNNLGIVQLTFWDGPDGTGNQLGPAFEDFVDPIDDGVNIYLPVQDGAETTDWTQVTVSGTAPQGTVSAKLLLIHVLTPPALGSGTVRWDDASVVGASTTPPGGLTLVWQDEFDSGTSPDPNTWTLETGYGGFFGWGNDEWQLYTNDPGNISIVYPDTGDPNNGYLSITARLDTAQCPSPAPPPGCGKRDGSITSARLITLPSQPGQGFAFTFGKIQASIQLPVGLGTWPAFWMLGEKFPITGWPKAGEIDIVELFDSGGTTNQQPVFAIHWCDETLLVGLCSSTNGLRTVSGSTNLGVSLGNAFHVYEAEWNASGVTWRVDGVTYYSAAIQPATMEEFLENFFIILNVAIGGRPVPTPSATGWPRTMLVDWVRVYQ